jgi:hypothetical protein
MDLPKEPEPRNPAWPDSPLFEGETEEHRDWRAFRWSMFLANVEDTIENLHAKFHELRDASS